DEQRPIAFIDRLKRTLLSLERKLEQARALYLEIAAQNVRDRDLFRLRKRFEARRDLVTLIDWKPMQTFEIPSRLAVTVLEPDPEALFAPDQIKRLRPPLDFRRLSLLI